MDGFSGGYGDFQNGKQPLTKSALPSRFLGVSKPDEMKGLRELYRLTKAFKNFYEQTSTFVITPTGLYFSSAKI
ncbi:MAG: hypothetical protein AAGM27_02970 [Cyanobacteria bacterium J06554_3]